MTFPERLRAASLTEYGLDIDKELMDEAADKIAEAAAFLDGMADRIEEESWGTGYSDEGKRDAADCRAMAKKLRGET